MLGVGEDECRYFVSCSGITWDGRLYICGALVTRTVRGLLYRENQVGGRQAQKEDTQEALFAGILPDHGTEAFAKKRIQIHR